MICNPNALSDDERKVRFGNWEQSWAYLYSKDGSKLFDSNNFELKQDQGPNKPSQEPEEEEEEEVVAPAKNFLFKNVKNHKLYKPSFGQKPQTNIGARAITAQGRKRITANKPVSAASRTQNKSVARK